MPPIPGLQLRLLGDGDSLAALTDLLHRAYARHLAAGLRFYASHQPVDVTEKRARKGECWVGEIEGQLVATATWVPPDRCGGSPWYDRADVASVGQFAVDPPFQRRGVGRAMMDLVERRASELGAAELALDTAENAAGLIAMYTARGYRFIEHVDWRPDTNYRSVVLSLKL